MNKTKLRSKLILSAVVVVLIFILVPAAAAAKSTKLDFNAIETYAGVPDFPVPDAFMFIAGQTTHIKDFWSYHLLEGTIGTDQITGYTFSIFHVKMNMVTGNWVLNGKTLFNLTWYYSIDDSIVELKGYFTGTINAKLVGGKISGSFTLQGFEAFEGMKLKGIVWSISPSTNGLSGTILIPD